ncbi:MAG TPA: class I SAM-dependent methyltransferase [Gaiella sp.]|uniref:class I SAM-dependent methyltransferase n=1 Tax=Gaiella sp. TaxID=2663207 RepID=UPI002D7F5879|nr:class I SAM-dependent methyltransferase [Gaiella sp.]HET9287743.1 class I SAM-dependent methyltransferase [Gaiella sp.]
MSDYDGFASIYDQFAAGMTEDVPFYVALAEKSRGPVVELAVGTGRVAVPIAEQTGRRVIGIDVSSEMLGLARRRAADAGVELDLRQGDMRELTLEQSTDLVICPFRAMLHLPGHDARVDLMRRVRSVLVPGGRFAWNAFVFDPAIAQEIDGVWRVEQGVRNRSTYDYAERRIDLTLENDATVRLWWVDRDEWEAAVAEAGLEIEALYGWFDGTPFDETSREFVYVTRRP